MRRQIVILNGIAYRLDKNQFFYEPIPDDWHYPHFGLIILALAIGSWAAIGYGVYQGWRAFHG